MAAPLPTDPDLAEHNPDAHLVRALTALGERRRVTATAPIFTSSGIKLVDQGAAIDARLRERLLEHRLAGSIDESAAIEHSVSAHDLRLAAERIVAQTPAYGRISAVDRLAILAALEALPLPAPIVLRLTLLQDGQPAAFDHAIAVAVLAAATAAALDSDIDRVTGLAVAGLLHDIGMLHLDPSLLEAGRAPSRDEMKHLYTHPLLSAAVVRQTSAYPHWVADAVHEHHERLDGSGYPHGLRAERVGMGGRVLMLADLAAAVLGPGGSRADEQRLAVILRLGRQKLDPRMADALAKALQLGADGGAARMRETRASGDHPGGADADLMRAPARGALAEALRPVILAWVEQRRQLAPLLAGGGEVGVFLGERIEALDRSLAVAGFHPDQVTFVVEQLDADDEGIDEVAMLVRECGWRMRDIVLEAFRRWPALAESAVPEQRALGRWLTEVEAQLRGAKGVSSPTPEEA